MKLENDKDKLGKNAGQNAPTAVKKTKKVKPPKKQK
jgi:hypothetical protein